jgi:hypothetical protein
MRPQIICTSSWITKARPKVSASSGTWPYWCTRRRNCRSIRAPMAKSTSGATISAGRKPTIFDIW